MARTIRRGFVSCTLEQITKQAKATACSFLAHTRLRESRRSSSCTAAKNVASHKLNSPVTSRIHSTSCVRHRGAIPLPSCTVKM
jgi:hypothetical protein